MGMCKIDWREKGDPMIDIIYKIEIFLYVRFFFSVLFF
jgi:hypothetical protein